MLELVLHHIKIFKVIIDLVIEIYKNKKMRVYTQMETIGFIQGKDAIDQGEVISLLICRIFYDPLLTVVDKRKDSKRR